MHKINQLLDQYISSRQTGIAAQDVVRSMNSVLGKLSSDERRTLAQKMSRWEDEQTITERPPETELHAAIKQKQHKITGPINGETVTCTHCGATNILADAICYRCGELLPNARTTDQTRQFAQPMAEIFSDDYFGPDSILLFRVMESSAEIEIKIKPQREERELIFGRRTESLQMMPDIDLTAADGTQKGVSRIHAALRYDRINNLIEVRDLGSSNGTYLNGQRLHAREYRILRNHDELSLGRMTLKVIFTHPEI